MALIIIVLLAVFVHQPVSDEDYLNSLPKAGLELAAQYLEQDYETLLENDLPVAGTVTNLLNVQTLLSEDEEEDEESA